MIDQRIRTTTEFLAEEVYLPGYMAIRKEDYDRNGGTFSFNVKEPPVARGEIVHYLTPRGLHICMSQAGYALVENMAREGLTEELDVSKLRETLTGGRVRIYEMDRIRFRREVGLTKPVQGKFTIQKFRLGKKPVLWLDFSIENSAVTGSFRSIIAPHPVPQTNADIMRK